MASKFQMEFMEVEFNFSAMASVVSLSPTALEVTGHFRSYSDYIGLTFNSKDYRMHEGARYPESSNYAGVSLSFSPSFNGSVTKFDSLSILPAMVINYNDGSQMVATLGFLSNKGSETDTIIEFTGGSPLSRKWIAWDSETVTWEKTYEKVIGYEDIFDDEGNYIETIEIKEEVYESGSASRGSDYAIDYLNGMIYPVAGGSIEYEADVTITYEYSLHQSYIINFSNLKQGTHPDNSAAIPTSNIKNIVIPIIPTFYVQGKNELTGRSDEITVTFNNWTVSGGSLGSFPSPKAAHPFRTAEGYDDEYYRNPYRIVQAMHHLGYRKVINLYVGASHYYDKKGNAGASSIDHKTQTLITTIGVCTAAKKWYRYLLKAMKAFDFEDIIVSMSMENLQMPEPWKQRLHNGEAGQTGWEPPTSFFSPTNTAVRTYWEKVVKDYLDISRDEGFAPILQLGEPWWWWQEFQPGNINIPYPGRPPCFYDDATKNLYQSEKGKSLPVFTSSTIELTNENLEAIEWLRDKLGDFSDFAKGIAKSYTGGIYTVLFFPPSVLDQERVPEAMRIANYPTEYWKLGNLDFIQIEDYDWVVHDNENHPDIFDFARNPNLKYQPHLTHYFAGFAWEQFLLPINTQWERIEKAAVKGLSAGMLEVFVWAGTQIRRDSWSPKMPIKYIPAVINRTLVHIEETN